MDNLPIANHRFRLNLFSKEKEFVLFEDKIQVIRNGKTKSISLDTIHKINLKHLPGVKLNPEQYICTIHYDKNKKEYFVNQSVESANVFNDLSPSYLNFVELLHQKIAEKNIKYDQGSGIYFPMFVFLIISVTALSIIAINAFLKDKFNLGVTLLIGAISIYLIFKSLLKSLKQKDYNPKDIPEKLLPKME